MADILETVIDIPSLVDVVNTLVECTAVSVLEVGISLDVSMII